MSKTISQAEAARVLRRAGYPDELITEILDQLGDPVDLDRDGPMLLRYGITRSHLIDMVGGSP